MASERGCVGVAVVILLVSACGGGAASSSGDGAVSWSNPAPDGGGTRPVEAGTAAEAGAAVSCLGVASPAGGPCSCTADCPAGAACALEAETNFPGGYCVQSCVPTDPAPAGYICETLSIGAGLFTTCDAIHRCRSAYVCIVDVATHVGTCDSQCSRDSQCSATGHCDLYSGLCKPEGTGSGLNGVCARPEQCKSGLCFTGSGATPNFCATNCNLLDPVCPEQGICEAISSDPSYTAGLCFLPCQNGACAAGFECSPHGACLPTF